MMLLLQRKYIRRDYTIGRLYVDGVFFSNTLEPTIRDLNRNGKFDNGEKKIKRKTAIPYGLYRVLYNWSPKFGRNLPRLLDVPEFEGVLIHSGNSVMDTAGCIIVGENKIKGGLVNSRYWSDLLNKKIDSAIQHGERVEIEIL
jgi:hypothetical protein